MQMRVFIQFFLIFLQVERLINALPSYIPSKQVQINQVYVVQYGDGQLSADTDQNIVTQVTFPKLFNRVPQVLLATFDLDLDGTKILNSNWQLTTQGISKTGFSSKLIKKGLQHIYTLGYYYLAIDSDDVYIFSNQVAFFKANAIVVNGKLVQTFTISYQRVIDTTKTKRIMTAFYTGYDQTTTDNSQAKLSIFLEIIQLQDYAQLIITSEQTNNYMDLVFYNYMEYYEDIDQNFLVLESFEERVFQAVPVNSSLNSNKIDRLQSVSPFYTNIGSIQGILCGLSGLQIPPKNEVLRLTIQNINFLNNYLNYQYETWQDTVIQGVTSNVLVFKQLDCNIYFNFQCVNSCPSHYFMYYDQVKAVNLCQKCYTLCSECLGQLARQCTKCFPGFILSNGSCICPENQLLLSDNTCGCSENYELVQGKCQEKTYFSGKTVELLNKSADVMSKTAITVTGILTGISSFTKSDNRNNYHNNFKTFLKQN
ncbi:H-type lectin domain protein (macronuclear) [Tetrahymena thermophila SB210]|uniref:H-type lectin domain protein n=1 Tax=Tetrahymena thermophila (strain SB210) TaxID=312017 RepID=Q22NY7_TETTS|nr:H-type lectin domain protein [Tetrahymena thermophila SB210]EAR87024.2 H-type lectin domain protein [Tetrahymena thermophila SB210]|eukprot:XP_001007269.2 H-type lectin domain protein [Tetrahymena thermophila SB210]